MTTVDDIDILARTIWGEARGEDEIGREAVADVVMNRVIDPRWPNTISEVCLQPQQFSCWNDDDPNLEQMEQLTLEDPLFRQCYAIAASYAAEMGIDVSEQANHYCRTDIANEVYWVEGQTPTTIIGAHSFYKL